MPVGKWGGVRCAGLRKELQILGLEWVFVSLMCFMDMLASTKASSSVGNTGNLREAAWTELWLLRALGMVLGPVWIWIS